MYYKELEYWTLPHGRVSHLHCVLHLSIGNVLTFQVERETSRKHYLLARCGHAYLQCSFNHCDELTCQTFLVNCQIEQSTWRLICSTYTFHLLDVVSVTCWRCSNSPFLLCYSVLCLIRLTKLGTKCFRLRWNSQVKERRKNSPTKDSFTEYNPCM